MTGEIEMIDTKELRSMVNGAQFESFANSVINSLLDRLEAAEKERDVLRDMLALESQENGALRDSVDRACEGRDAYKTAFEEWHQKTGWVQQGINDGSIPPTYLGWHRADVMADMLKSARRDYCVLEGYYAELAEKLEAAEKAVTEAYQRGYATGQEEIAAELEFAKKEITNLHDDISEWMDKCDALRAEISDLTINVEYLGNLKKSYEELIGELQDERDKALLRQALEALEQIARDLPWELTAIQADTIATLRDRLGEKE